MFDFNNFKAEILREYDSKKEKGELSTRLENPSPANLRDHALHLFNNGLNADDEVVFNEFFEATATHADLAVKINRMDLGRMKSVQNFIKKSSTNPDESIVKLLAILINFNPRPYAKWKNLTTNIDRISVENIETTNVETTITAQAINQSENSKYQSEVSLPEDGITTKIASPKRRNILVTSIAAVSLFAVGLGSYQHLQKEQCMYWNGYEYISIDCTSKQRNVEIIALDENVLHNFKKIKNIDTLNASHEGKIWYTKYKQKVEFYTSYGQHPERKDIQLRPATSYMINKYILKNTIDSI